MKRNLKINEIKNSKKEYRLHNSIPFFIKDPLPENIDLQSVISILENRIPEYLFHYVDIIYVGHFDDFDENNTNAKYQDGAIYLTNLQDDVRDMIDDIVHELAHAISENNTTEIFSDYQVENEFVLKRKQLERILRYKGHSVYGLRFANPDYSLKFDEFLYKEVGYSALRTLSSNIFTSPYAITSIQEYFASGFEEFYIGDRRRLYKISPKLYNKINELNNLGENI